MKQPLNLLVGLVTIFLLSGCESFKALTEQPDVSGEALMQQPGRPVLISREDSLHQWVDLAMWMDNQPLQVLKPLVDDLKTKNRDSMALRDQVTLAMLLSVPNTGFQDDAKALALLKGASKEASRHNQNLMDFIRMQELNIQRRQQLNVTWQKQMAAQKERVALLENQLQELKSIEQGLINRQGNFQ